MTQPWGQRPTRRCHRISPHRLIIWRGAKPLLCKDAPHAGQGGQAVGRRARSARTASTRWTARTRAACHAARISAGSEGASSTARSRRCISRSSSRMLSCRHSIGHRPPLETLVRGSKSVPHFRCYASPPPTKTCAPYSLIGSPRATNGNTEMRVLVVTIEEPVGSLPYLVLNRHVRAACRQRRTRGVTDRIGTKHNLVGGKLDTHDVILRRYGRHPASPFPAPLKDTAPAPC